METFYKFFSIDNLRRGLPTILLIIGSVLFIYGVFGEFDDPKWKEFVSGLGKTLLAGSIFSILLKTAQFLGVFKEEIEKVIYDTRFIRNRADLSEYWEKVTKELFKDQFPKINKSITKDVKEIYLPTKSVLYFDDYSQMINIKLIDKAKELVEVEQKTRLKILPLTPFEKFDHTFTNTISYGNNEENAKYCLESLKVNGQVVDIQVDSKKENSKLINKFIVSLSGSEAYEIEKVVKKTYSLKDDNMLGHMNNYIKNNFRVQFFTEGVSIDFFEAGTLSKFKTENSKSGYLEKKYEGIIYPKQGYFVIIKSMIE